MKKCIRRSRSCSLNWKVSWSKKTRNLRWRKDFFSIRSTSKRGPCVWRKPSIRSRMSVFRQSTGKIHIVSQKMRRMWWSVLWLHLWTVKNCSVMCVFCIHREVFTKYIMEIFSTMVACRWMRMARLPELTFLEKNMPEKSFMMCLRATREKAIMRSTRRRRKRDRTFYGLSGKTRIPRCLERQRWRRLSVILLQIKKRIRSRKILITGCLKKRKWSTGF